MLYCLHNLAKAFDMNDVPLSVMILLGHAYRVIKIWKALVVSCAVTDFKGMASGQLLRTSVMFNKYL